MSSKAIRAIISLVVIGGALSALLFVTMQGNAQFYKHVDEVMPQAQQWYGKNLQLHGFVVANTIMRRPDSLDYRFKIQNNDSVVLASYTGVVPDTFKDGAEVVLTGHLSPDGFHVDPNGVTAKCPSKYDPSQQQTPGTSASASPATTEARP
jgi:cytochrome c-type biogenesis protein CcmE